MIDIKQVIKNNGGIQPPHLIFYMESIRFNLESAMKSIDFLTDFANKQSGNPDDLLIAPETSTQILNHVHTILIHASSISKFFWPPQKGKNHLHKERAKTLRTYFSLDETSPLKNRELRNFIEHFEENLDNFLWAAPPVGIIIPSYVGYQYKNSVPTHFFKAFFLDSATYETLGKRYSIQEIVDEICKLDYILSSYAD